MCIIQYVQCHILEINWKRHFRHAHGIKNWITIRAPSHGTKYRHIRDRLLLSCYIVYTVLVIHAGNPILRYKSWPHAHQSPPTLSTIESFTVCKQRDAAVVSGAHAGIATIQVQRRITIQLITTPRYSGNYHKRQTRRHPDTDDEPSISNHLINVPRLTVA